MISTIDGLCLVDDRGLTTFVDRVAPDAEEAAKLLGAWLEERGRSVECLLLLERVQRLLARITADGELKGKSGREARQILEAIEAVAADRSPAGL